MTEKEFDMLEKNTILIDKYYGVCLVKTVSKQKKVLITYFGRDIHGLYQTIIWFKKKDLLTDRFSLYCITI